MQPKPACYIVFLKNDFEAGKHGLGCQQRKST